MGVEDWLFLLEMFDKFEDVYLFCGSNSLDLVGCVEFLDIDFWGLGCVFFLGFFWVSIIRYDRGFDGVVF